MAVAGFGGEEVWREVLQFLAIDTQGAGRMKVLLPLFSSSVKKTRLLWKVLQEHFIVGKWFRQGSVIDWKKFTASQNIALLTTGEGLEALSGAHLDDLLSHPDFALRQNAFLELRKRDKTSPFAETIQLIAEQKVSFSREQQFALLTVFRTKGDLFYSYLSQWFDTGPDPHSVLKIITARKHHEELDPLNVESARYLSRVDWEPSLAELKRLTGHPEMLARAIAYAKLDAKKPSHARVLRDMAAIEPSKRIREQLEKKLDKSSR
jgi:hypothetical protein